MNKELLYRIIHNHNDTTRTLSQFLGISRVTLIRKINRTKGADFTQGEICRIRAKYSLTDNEVIKIFFS